MTVKHLRDLLATLPQEAEVLWTDGDQQAPLDNHHLQYSFLESDNQLFIDLTAWDPLAEFDGELDVETV